MTRDKLEARSKRIIAEIRCAHRPGCNCYRQVVKQLADERDAVEQLARQVQKNRVDVQLAEYLVACRDQRDRALALLREATGSQLAVADQAWNDRRRALLAEVDNG